MFLESLTETSSVNYSPIDVPHATLPSICSFLMLYVESAYLCLSVTKDGADVYLEMLAQFPALFGQSPSETAPKSENGYTIRKKYGYAV